MKRLALVACLIAACNQRDPSQAKPSAAPAPTPAPKIAAAQSPPDADVYEVELQPPPEVAPIAVAPPDARKTSAHDDEAALEAEAKKYADLLTADDPNGDTGADLNARRRPGADLGQQIADVKDQDKVVSIGGGAGRGTSGGGASLAGAGSASSDPAPPGRISVSSKQSLDDTTLTPDVVLAKIMAVYMPSIKRCYRDDLKRDPTARGKVVLRLTVDETGRTVNATADTFDDTLGACIGGAMAAWRFAIPKDRDGDPTDAAFQINLQLVPQ